MEEYEKATVEVVEMGTGAVIVASTGVDEDSATQHPFEDQAQFVIS